MPDRGLVKTAGTLLAVVLGAGFGGASSLDEAKEPAEQPVRVAALPPTALAMPVRRLAKPAPPRPAVKSKPPRPRADGRAERWKAWAEAGKGKVMSSSEASLREFARCAWLEAGYGSSSERSSSGP